MKKFLCLIIAIVLVYSNCFVVMAEETFNIPYWEANNAGNALGSATVVTNEAHSGTKSLKVEKSTDYTSNIYFTFYQTVSVEPNTAYHLAFWAKGTVERIKYSANDFSNTRWVGANSNWTQYHYAFTTAANQEQAIIRIVVEGRNTNIYFDDFSFYKEADGTPVQMLNEGFETVFSLDDLEYSESNCSLSWTDMSDAGYEGANIYLKNINGELAKINSGLIPKGTSTFIIPAEYIGDESVTFVVKPMISGREYSGSEIVVQGTIDVGELIVEKNGHSIPVGLESGTLTLSRFITNNKMISGCPIQLIAVLYHNGEMIDMQIGSNNIPIIQSDFVTTNITVPELTDDKFELHIFLWDSIQEQNNYRKVIVLR